MTSKSIAPAAMAAISLLAAVLLFISPLQAATPGVTELLSKTHVHGMSVDVRDPSRLYLATHAGLYLVGAEGGVTQISSGSDDYMGFVQHPSEHGVFYASGHPARGGNTGVLNSTDGGQTWSKLSDGVGGPVDFHQMAISLADPNVMYGTFGNLQKSSDGGRNWTVIAPAPAGLMSLAAGNQADVLYSGTRDGLFRSGNDGQSWQLIHDASAPATMVQVTADGMLFAYVNGLGLMRATEQDLTWNVVEDGFADNSFVQYFSVAPTDSDRYYMIIMDQNAGSQVLVTSQDGGQQWTMPGSN